MVRYGDNSLRICKPFTFRHDDGIVVEWFVYMLRCNNGSLYVGETSDIAHRVADHNRGRGFNSNWEPKQAAFAIGEFQQQRGI